MNFKSFSEWELSEGYRSKNHNLYKVADSKDPITGKPIFQESDLQNFYAIRRKIQDNLEGFEKHMEMMEVKDKAWREKVKGQRGEKGDLAWYDTAKKTRELAIKVVRDSAKFMIEFNETYDKLKADLLGSDHVKVANAIVSLLEIYPQSLINEAGKLKRLKRMQADSQFVKDSIKWSESIRNMYENLEEAGKMLGKTDKQIEAARKQSAMQRMRWGMY
jgi:hypothetical protein